ncbi:hypothetical protein GIB67_018639 [Kingdonia uniflora]|uniref:Protein kinase domain-containing protein n=1 Tax=Kingdonia uniflora TaxID=39325 RepID=A0A7J7M2H2_9MAGN|nr:hypothetical protein GIB67_018639 [Kingdonia uniflora]
MGSSMSCCCEEKVDEGGSSHSTGGNNSWRIFTYKELHVATNGFSDENKLGEGGFGSVYWGKTTDGLQIAVKKLKSMNSKAEMEFAVEVEVLGRVRHKNLLGLRGYCAGADQRLIVYDYMPNLSLLSHLHGQFASEVQLDWKRRMNVAIGSAEGLMYLHQLITPHIIHRDIKASNVLLDSNFEPLVADFGFAKLIPDGVSHMTTRVKGTLGYLAPEYAMWGKVSESCDVYSYGILLLELLTGRKPIEKLPGGIKRTVTEWAEPYMIKGRYKDLVDPKLRGDFDENQLKQALKVAALCVQNEPEKRPNIKEVVNLLKGYDLKGRVMQMRMDSVKYGDDLMAYDQASDNEDGDDDKSNYGVFGALETQKMQLPHTHRGRNTAQSRADPEEIMGILAPGKILVGLSLDAEASNELLSWAIRIAARPNDTVVALHVLVQKELSKKRGSTNCDNNKFRQAKAFVISALGEFAEICQSKEVNLEAKVGTSVSIQRGLTEEAAAIEATFLIVGSSSNRNLPLRSSPEITKFCFEYAPQSCSVVSIAVSGQPHKNMESEVSSSDGSCQSSLELSNKDIHIGKIISSYSQSESFCEKVSPRAVLGGFEGGSDGTEEDCFSLENSSMTESPPQTLKRRSRSKLWRNLSMVNFRFPFFSSSFDGREKEISDLSADEETTKPSWRCFSYSEISIATNNFHPDNIVGRGGYAEVYRGELNDGQTIAVKRLAKDNIDENKQKEFLVELGILGHVCHSNTAFLVGFCTENGLHLIFKFSPNGNLSSALHEETGNLLEWSVRYRIVIGVARGLHYLHKCCKRRIIHRDIKASNVLLGPEFEPQISDFGLAKWLPKQWTHHTLIPIEGTFGYLAPEYFMHGIVDEKTDVFALGVLILEIITGRRPVDSSKQNILLWAKPLMECGDISELADPKMGGKYDVDEMRRLVLTVSYCVRQSSLWRPTMTEVLQLLTDGHESEIGLSCKMPEFIVDEMDDYSVDFDSRFCTNQIFQ